MQAPRYKMAAPCRCGGQAKVFGPSEFAPASHWGVYCSDNSCDKMVSADDLDEAIEMWNESQLIEYHL
jgi:hypothetical protein